MAHDVIDGDARGERDTTLQVLALLAGKGLLDLLLNHGIDRVADSCDIGTGHAELRGLGEARYYRQRKLDFATRKDRVPGFTYHQ